MKKSCLKRGFTLIELLVVVLIIGILAAIALPQYQKAVLKSRFNSLMPTTKSIRDGQEMYFLTNNNYADSIEKLDVQASNTDGMAFAVDKGPDFAYVFATRGDINNNLVMYQKHSKNFPNEIHCEAQEGNDQAKWLCETGLHGTPINGSLAEGYKTYVLQGAGTDFPVVRIRGDINQDGKVDVADVNAMVSIVTGNGTCEDWMDMNGDGKCDVSDIGCIGNIVYGRGDSCLQQ